jgi:hypothetical protein
MENELIAVAKKRKLQAAKKAAKELKKSGIRS